MPIITNPPSAAMLRAARHLLGWPQQDLAQRAGVSDSHLSLVEREATPGEVDLGCTMRIARALEAGGVEFVFDRALGHGLRLRPPTAPGGEPWQEPSWAVPELESTSA